MKIVILDGYALNPGDLSWKEWEELGEVTVYDRTRTEEAAERIGKAEIVITNKTALPAETLASCPAIRYIGVLATGYNVVDTAAAAAAGIPVCNIPTYGTDAVAQFTFAHLLNICHRVEDHSASVRRGEWSSSADFCYWRHPLTELAGKTMGIIGFGRIGRAVARIALAFGMEVLAYDEKPVSAVPASDPSAGERDRLRFTDMTTLYRSSDVISLHCPLFDSNRGLINRETLALMKPGVILLNTSRGPLIVEQDLAAALKRGQVRAAGLDVVSEEPIRPDNPLLNSPNCFITPHIAWAPLESRRRLMAIAVENLKAFLAGRPVNRVN